MRAVGPGEQGLGDSVWLRLPRFHYPRSAPEALKPATSSWTKGSGLCRRCCREWRQASASSWRTAPSRTGSPTRSRRRRRVHCPRLYLDRHKGANELGYRPRVTVEEGLAALRDGTKP